MENKEENIENEEDLPDFPKSYRLRDKDESIIRIDGKHSPAILSGILGCNVKQIYQYRQTNQLPPHSTATYRECIQHFIKYYRNKVNARATTMGEAKLEEDIKLSIVKRELANLELMEARSKLIDMSQLADIFEPTFAVINSGLIGVAKRHPESAKEIMRLLKSWELLGEQFGIEAKEEMDTFVDSAMSEELDVDIDPEANKGLNSFE